MSSESEEDFLSADEGEGEVEINNGNKTYENENNKGEVITERTEINKSLNLSNCENIAQSEATTKTTKYCKIKETDLELSSELGKSSHTNEDCLRLTEDDCVDTHHDNQSDRELDTLDKVQNRHVDTLVETSNRDLVTFSQDGSISECVEKGTSKSIPTNAPNTESSESTEREDTNTEIVETVQKGPDLKVDRSVEEKTASESGTEKQRKKNPRESKIGVKKPREKLGERLGNKKLGARITKPLIGISSDSLEDNKSDKATRNVDLNTSNLKIHSDTSNKRHSDEIQKGSTEEGDSNSTWNSWGDWGYTLASAASTITKEVTRGVGTVLETVESGIGAPDPMDLAKEMVEKEKKLKSELETSGEKSFEEEKVEKTDSSLNSGFEFGNFGSFVSGVSGILGTAGSKVIHGSLDTLERFGRKTMELLEEGDPGLRRKRAFLNSSKPNLSQILKEARERAIAEEELRSNPSNKGSLDKTQVSLLKIWDNTEGPAHLEALALIAKHCQRKNSKTLTVGDISPMFDENMKKTLMAIQNCNCIIDEHKVDNIHSKMMDITRDVELPLQFNKLLAGWPSLQESLSKLSIEICSLGSSDFTSIQEDLYKEIAVYIAHVVGVIHKAAEIALVTPELDCLRLAQQFQRLCGCISGGLEISADEICDSISRVLPSSDKDFNNIVTNIYVQMSEVNSYMEKALIDLTVVLSMIEAKTL